MAVIKFDIEAYEDRVAAECLLEGSKERAIAALEAGKVGAKLRAALASMLRGGDGARFEIKYGKEGRPPRRTANFHRDFTLALAVEDVMARRDLTASAASAHIAKNHPLARSEKLGEDSVRRAYGEIIKNKNPDK